MPLVVPPPYDGLYLLFAQLKMEFYRKDYEEYNIIEVVNGTVRVREADCRSQDCVYRGAADWGEIVCLPHGMRIEVNGEEAQPPADY